MSTKKEKTKHIEEVMRRNGLEVREEEKKGRKVISKRRIEAGEVVFRSEAYGAVVTERERGIRCDFL